MGSFKFNFSQGWFSKSPAQSSIGSDAGSSNEQRVILTEASHPGVLGYAFPSWKKWQILAVVFLVQVSMNLNASLPADAQEDMMKIWGVSKAAVASVCALFLITYAFGCELWAPWSEELGRYPIIQLSLGLVNIFGIGAALSQTFTQMIVCRALGGLFTAGGSVTLGIVADMYRAEVQQGPVAFIVLASVGGSIFGPIIGGYIKSYHSWTWCFWGQVAGGIVVQLLHMFLCYETRSSTLLTRHAKKLRKNGTNPNAYGPDDHKTWREILQPKELITLWMRPFRMFVTDRIVLVLSLLSGFSDALIFMGFQAFGRVYKTHGFEPYQVGLTFAAIGFGYIIAYGFNWVGIRRNMFLLRQNPNDEYAKYESRLWWLKYTAPFLPIGLFIFGWTSLPHVHWIGPIVGSAVIGVANYAIYQTTIDYMVAVYGVYSSSATGGNGFARDFLAGVLTWAADPYYEGFRMVCGDDLYLPVANSVLGVIGLILVIFAIMIYYKGPAMRRNSPFANKLAEETEGNELQPTV